MGSSNEFKDRIKKAARVAGVSLGAAGMVATGLTGCNNEKEPEPTKPITIEIKEPEPTKDNGEKYTEEEKESIKEIIVKKNEFIDIVEKEFEKNHSEEELEVGVIKATNLFMWEDSKGKKYVHAFKYSYPSYTKVDRAEGDYDLIVVNNESEKILCTFSYVDGKLEQSLLNDSTDYPVNDAKFDNNGTFINENNTLEECVKGAEALFEYNNEQKYYEWELYFEKQQEKDNKEYSDKEATSTVVEDEYEVEI